MDRARRCKLSARYFIGALSVVFLALTATAAGAAVLPGVPTEDSLLFSINSRSGELKREGKSKTRYELTLSGVGRDTTWFSDRPRRDAGHVNSRRLFSSWGKLGFRKTPPNGALVISEASRKRDTLALELKLRSYNSNKRQARFDARRLGSLGRGLSNLNKRLDRPAPVRFRNSSLFVDNASAAVGCSLGQPQLLPKTGGSVLRMIPADGSLLPVAGNAALFSIYGTKFGGDGKTNFGVPKLVAPAGMAWYVCTAGVYPSPGSIAPSCNLGEVDYFVLPFPLGQFGDPNWSPADGRRLPTSQYSTYAASYASTAQATFQAPNVPAPPGFTSFVCVGFDLGEGPSLSQVDMYVGQPDKLFGENYTSVWKQANGAQLPVNSNDALYDILGTNFGGNGGLGGNFALPNLASPAAGVSYYMAVEGFWPFN